MATLLDCAECPIVLFLLLLLLVALTEFLAAILVVVVVDTLGDLVDPVVGTSELLDLINEPSENG